MLHQESPPTGLPNLNTAKDIPNSPKSLILIVTSLISSCILTFILFFNGIEWLLNLWSHNDYSHGYLVPFISLYIVWYQRERYKNLPVQPSYALSIFLIFSCLVLLFISKAAAFIQLEIAALFLILPALVIFIFGLPIARALLFPWLYLSFALPWFDLFINHAQPLFQKISAYFGALLLRIFYPVYLDNIYIHLPSIQMEVAKACSGVNFLISVMALGTALVYLTQRSKVSAFAVLLSGLPIIIISNSLRIATAGILGENFGPRLLHGPSHILQGWLVAWLGWGGLFLVNWLFIKFSTSEMPILSDRWRFKLPSQNSYIRNNIINTKSIYSLSIGLLLSIILVNFFSPRPVNLASSLSSFPLTIGMWKGTEANWLENKYHFTEGNEQLERIYRNIKSGNSLYLYISYYSKQDEDHRLIRQLSQPLHRKATLLTLKNTKKENASISINHTFPPDIDTDFDYHFWYQFPNSQIVPHQNQARITALKNGLTVHANNGAIVIVGSRHKLNKEISQEDRDNIWSFIFDIQNYLNLLIQ